MSNGITAYNYANQLLISQDFKNLHFWEKAVYQSQSIPASSFGGCMLWTYSSNCPQYPVVFFSAPVTNAYYGISRIYGSPGAWSIELMCGRAGTSQTPSDVYVFSNPVGFTTSQNMGIIVYSNDSTPSFDSRLSPLSVNGAQSVTIPSVVFTHAVSGSPYACGGYADGTPDQENTYIASYLTSMTKPILSYSSLAQTAKELYYTQYNEMCNLHDGYGGCIDKAWTRYESWYWYFYRGGVKLDKANGRLNTSWVTANYGCRWQETGNSGFLGGGNNAGGGSWPYNNETLNMQARTVLVSEGSLYD